MENTLDAKKENLLTEQKIKLIDGLFSAKEAADIIDAVLNIKINHHKLKRLSITEGNSNDSCEYDTGRIDELLKAKQDAKEYFNSVKEFDGRLRINSMIDISLEQ
ncbi:hypothetical protein [Hanstruepera flava]|uniref:hypothetical protein n=1 Tax=Hanstruepera flava TaxID=2930218 RepID=UPI002027B01E|nr:hypothetical protein [Hanstruepera flava]